MNILLYIIIIIIINYIYIFQPNVYENKLLYLKGDSEKYSE